MKQLIVFALCVIAISLVALPVGVFADHHPCNPDGSNPDPTTPCLAHSLGVNVTGSVVSGGTTLGLINPLGPTGTVPGILQRIVNFMVVLGAPIAAAMIIYAAFQMMFAGGDPKKFQGALHIILYTLLGYGIILIGWGFTSIIREILGVQNTP